MNKIASVWENIENLNLNSINFLVCDKENGYGWSETMANEIEYLYRCYLKLCAKYPSRILPPTHEIDKFWHMHILDTFKYIEDCDRIFGNYLHHFPYFGKRDKAEKNELETKSNEMRELMEQEFDINLTQTSGATCGGSYRINVDNIARKPRPEKNEEVALWSGVIWL